MRMPGWLQWILVIVLVAPNCAALTNLERTLNQLIKSILEMFESFSPF